MFKSFVIIIIAPMLLVFGLDGTLAGEKNRAKKKEVADYFLFNQNEFKEINAKNLMAKALIGDKEEINRLPIEENSAKSDFYPARNWHVADPVISAESALIYDLSDEKIFYQKNINEILPIASLTKIITAMVVMDNLNLNEEIEINKDAVDMEGDYGRLVVGEKLIIEDLLNFLLISSSNDAAYSLAEIIGAKLVGEDKKSAEKVSGFINLMNKKNQEIGAENTKIFTPHGLDGNVSSVFDLLKIVKYSLKYPKIWEISANAEKIIYSTDKKNKHYLINSNKLLKNTPDIIGSKTGYTPKAGGCMILQFLNNQNKKIISIILGSEDREKDMLNLIDWSQKAYYW